MSSAREYLVEHQADFLHQLAELVAIESVSTDGQHGVQLQQAEAWVARALSEVGFKVRTYATAKGADVVFGELLTDPALPTFLLYSHYDVQPVDAPKWTTTQPFQMAVRSGRAWGRGTQDDKGGFVAQLAAITALRSLKGRLPVNLKVLVEGLEEVGSPGLVPLLSEHRDPFRADIIVVTDTDNLEEGRPAITNSLRGCLTLELIVRSAKFPSHSGTTGGGLADPSAALLAILHRLGLTQVPYSVGRLYDDVRPLTPAERTMIRSAEASEKALRERFGILPGVRLAVPADEFLLRTTRLPAMNIIALSAGSVNQPSNQVLPEARALLSVRLVPDQNPQSVIEVLRGILTHDPPWGVQVEVTPRGEAAAAWMVAPEGPVFAAALKALERGYGQPASYLGAGGTIGYVGPASQLLKASVLLLGISGGNAHSHDEFLVLDDWLKLQISLVELFEICSEELRPPS